MSKLRVLALVVLVTAVALAAALLPASRPVAAAPVSAEFVPDRVLVRFNATAAEAARVLARESVGGKLAMRYTLVPNLELLELSGLPVADAVARLQANPHVKYAQPDFIYHAVDTVPNDPRWGDLWGMTNIRAPLAWDTFKGDANLVVAIIDTGIDYNHQDLAANMWKNPGETAGDGIDNDGNGYIDDVYGWDFAYNDSNPSDVHGHGSHTGGTVGAAGNNGVGVVGVNWNIKLMALKFLNDSGSGSTADAIEAVQYATNKGVKISNNSWGGGGFDQGLYDAINAAKAVGHLFIAAAGNNGSNNDSSPFYPATYNLDNIISVAAISSSEAKASFSNYGKTTVDLGAPGVSILSTTPGNNYQYYDGTSMAAPHVSGVAALLYGLHPDWTYGQVRDTIFSTARPTSSMANITVTGGVLDAAAALGGTPPPTPTPVPTQAPSTLHLNKLAGSSANVNNNFWRATMTVTVHDGNHNPLSGAVVSGNWSGGTSGSTSCTTGSNGQCTMTKNLSKRAASSATYTITNITKSGYSYSSSGNEDSTAETVNRP